MVDGGASQYEDLSNSVVKRRLKDADISEVLFERGGLGQG